MEHDSCDQNRLDLPRLRDQTVIGYETQEAAWAAENYPGLRGQE